MVEALEEVVKAQIEVIEQVYGIQFINKTELISWILSSAHTDHEAYGLTAALNTWVAVNNLSGPVRVQESLFKQFSQAIDTKREFFH
jgi:hypothetical protein